jgi:hypothetical protein
LASLNHFTVPCSMFVIPYYLEFAARSKSGFVAVSSAENQSVPNDV